MFPRRKREELEARLAAEWAQERHPEAQLEFRAWLGPLPTMLDGGLYQVYSPNLYQVLGKWADVIALYPDRAVLAEVKIKLRPEALGQLLVYRDLFNRTPRFSAWNKLPLECIVVYAVQDLAVVRQCALQGIECEHYAPAWAREAYYKRVAHE